MNRLFGMMRYNKKLILLFVSGVLDLILIGGICVFDLVEFLIIKDNHAAISSLFLPLNILLIVLLVCSIIAIIVFMMISRRRKKEYGLF